MKSADKTRKRPSDDGNAAQTIRNAAAVLFAERGYHATTMRQLGKALGISAPSLYNHYSEKQDILFDIANGTMLALLEGGQEALASSDDPEEQFKAFLTAHVVFHADRKVEAQVADNELHSLEGKRQKEVIRTRDKYERILREILEAGKKRSGWNVPDPSVLTMGIFTMATGTSSWYRPGGRLTAEDVANTFSNFCLSAFRS